MRGGSGAGGRALGWANTRAGGAGPVDDVVLETAADEGCAMTPVSIEALGHV